MFSRIFYEEDLLEHPRLQRILQRWPQTPRVPCDRFGEVFNPNHQNFRLQKESKPSLILASKRGKYCLPTPEGYGIGSNKNFYFSHILNCLFDCRYCFLQGMFRSASLVLFVNYEDFQADIVSKIQENPGHRITFFSGYDGDSLVMDGVTGFCESFLPFFAQHPEAEFELRSKSIQIRKLLDWGQGLENCVVAFSLAPQNLTEALEHKTPSLKRRLKAIAQLQEQGWPIGLRFDPLIFHDGFEENYRNFFREVFSVVDGQRVHSVSLGTFRAPKAVFKNMKKLYPRETLFQSPFVEVSGQIAYSKELEASLMGHCAHEILKYCSESRFFPCGEVPQSSCQRC